MDTDCVKLQENLTVSNTIYIQLKGIHRKVYTYVLPVFQSGKHAEKVNKRCNWVYLFTGTNLQLEWFEL